MPRIYLPPNLLFLSGNEQTIHLKDTEETLGELLTRLEDRHPGMLTRIMEGSHLNPVFKVMLNYQFTNDLQMKIKPNSELALLL